MTDDDHLADKKDYKFSKEFTLKLFPINLLPSFIKENLSKHEKYLDLD